METDSNITIRKGVKEDIRNILTIFECARRYMRANNNPLQWNSDYPGETDIIKDMENGNSYVGEDENGKLVMTFAFIIGEDPTYKVIKEGNWLNDAPYATIHRIASNGKTAGVLNCACDYCFQFVDNIRIDTHRDNKPMLKALERLGFQECGIICCRDGSPRMAFQKIKDKE